MFWYPSIFNNSSSTSILVMEEFHDFTMLILFSITLFILIVIMRLCMAKFFNYLFMDNSKLETIWTILPIFILLSVAYPSLFYLYLMDLSIEPKTTIKIFGAQWYWIYEEFDQEKGYSESSYFLNDKEMLESNLKLYGWRLLETDTRMIVPYGSEFLCLTTSLDVIHSFSIPELGLKIDAVPGRLNSVICLITRPGIFYGQCAEICGTGHPFMPICLEAI